MVRNHVFYSSKFKKTSSFAEDFLIPKNAKDFRKKNFSDFHVKMLRKRYFVNQYGSQVLETAEVVPLNPSANRFNGKVAFFW